MATKMPPGFTKGMQYSVNTGMAANALTKYLNIKCGRLKDEYSISYENKARHSGRRVTLILLTLESSR